MEFLFSTPYENIILFLFVIAVIAGFVDAIAGGGGLITVPSLLLSGVPPLTVLGTNRMQSAIGELTAFITFWRNNAINVSGLWIGAIATTIGAVLGSYAVSLFSTDLLKSLLPILMMLITLYSIFSSRLRSSIRSSARLSTAKFMIMGGVLIGFYNGFFGPGTGSIWMLAFLALLGLTVKEASIATKPLNLIGNVISMFFFINLGAVDFTLGLAMGVGQIIGAFVGSHVVISNGDKIVRPVFITVCCVMTTKLIYEERLQKEFVAQLSMFF
jgi:uncharacterized membrane protein YfcA